MKSLGIKKEKKRRENWYGCGGVVGYSIRLEEELLKLSGQAIITKQPH